MQNIANDTINAEDLRLEDFFGPVSNVDPVELPPPPESSLPITVSVGPSSRTLLESANAAILAYNRRNGESVFFQDSSLVEVIKDSSGTPLIRELTADRLLSILTRNAYWVDYQTDKDVKLSLPQARMVLTSTPAELPCKLQEYPDDMPVSLWRYPVYGRDRLRKRRQIFPVSGIQQPNGPAASRGV